MMTVSISPRGLTDEERKRWNRLFNLNPLRVLVHSAIERVARGVSIGWIPYEHIGAVFQVPLS